MKRKDLFFVTCCLVLSLLLGGCGNGGASREVPAGAEDSSTDWVEPAEVIEETITEGLAGEEDISDFLARIAAMTDDELDVLLSDDSLTDAEFNALIAEIDARVAAKAEAELHGIIAMIATNARRSTYEIICIDPDDGNISTVNNFNIVISSDSSKYSYFIAGTYAHFANCQNIFSADYSKIAVSQYNNEIGVTHAGWCDANGTFFDVTLAINPDADNGFSDAIQQNAQGFTEDGGFIYSEGANVLSSPCYIVPIDNITAETVQSFEWADNITLPDNDWHAEAKITDWVDNNRCLVDYDGSSSDTSKVYNHATQTFTDYIPVSSRKNWSGVVSPDGQQIAFLSKQPNADGIDIFITSLDRVEPVQLNMAQTLYDRYGKMESEPMGYLPIWITLLDWR